MKRLTITKIAELAGVSKATVSRVLNGYPYISPEVREQVQSVIDETGFTPNQVARSLASDRSNIIGLVIPKGTEAVFADPYFPVLTNGISQTSNNSRLTLALFIFHSIQEGHDTIRSIVATGLLDGLILTSDRVTQDRNTDPFLPRLVKHQIPFVLIGRPEKPQNIPFVDVDNVGGGQIATTHLIECGYQRIAIIASQKNPAGDDRLAGYRQALKEHNIPFDSELVEFGDYTLESGYEVMKKLLLRNPDAVFVVSDIMAVGALRAIQETDLKVPQDIGVVGYDDLPPAVHAHPQLTTVRQPIEKLGNIAVEMLLQIMNDESDEVLTKQVILPCELTIRDSTRIRPL